MLGWTQRTIRLWMEEVAPPTSPGLCAGNARGEGMGRMGMRYKHELHQCAYTWYCLMLLFTSVLMLVSYM